MTDNATPTPSSAEHDAAMVAKFEANTAPQAPEPAAGASPERPAWLPEKFETPEDFAKSYGELEARLAKGPEVPAQDPATATAEDAAKVAEAAGLDYEALSTKYASTGSLEAADYAALEAKGIPRTMVDAFIAGQEALATGFENSVKSAVGGEEGFSKMAAWASGNLTEAELNAFNNSIDAATASGDIEAAKLALVGLKARYDEANGTEPKLLGGVGGGGEGDVYRSSAELTADMRDPRYAKDPAFRADVEAKVARSNIF